MSRYQPFNYSGISRAGDNFVNARRARDDNRRKQEKFLLEKSKNQAALDRSSMLSGILSSGGGYKELSKAGFLEEAQQMYSMRSKDATDRYSNAYETAMGSDAGKAASAEIYKKQRAEEASRQQQVLAEGARLKQQALAQGRNDEFTARADYDASIANKKKGSQEQFFLFLANGDTELARDMGNDSKFPADKATALMRNAQNVFPGDEEAQRELMRTHLTGVAGNTSLSKLDYKQAKTYTSKLKINNVKLDAAVSGLSTDDLGIYTDWISSVAKKAAGQRGSKGFVPELKLAHIKYKSAISTNEKWYTDGKLSLDISKLHGTMGVDSSKPGPANDKVWPEPSQEDRDAVASGAATEEGFVNFYGPGSY